MRINVTIMSKFKGTRVAGISAIAALALVIGGSTIAVANGYNPFPQEQPAAAVETAAPALFVGTNENGLAAEEEATAAAAEAARVAAEAQAAADAAAAAAQAAADAQAVADAAARQASPESSSDDSGSDDAPSTGGGLPTGAVPPNVAGSDQPDSTACSSSSLTWNGSQSVCG